MNRYLLNISYIGTTFRGMQKTINKAEGPILDTRSIQGCLEIALQKLRPVNTIDVVLSSRTDAGVHALQSSVHVDLENYHGSVFPTTSITSVLNRHFCKNELQIRVISTIHVPNTFHCRYNAKGRSYLYRLAVAKENLFTNGPERKEGYVSFIPIEEIDRCYFIQDAFNIEIFKEAAQLFVGIHDFRTFMNSNKRNVKQNHPRYTLRNIESITIQPGRSLANEDSCKRGQKFYNYLDITFKGRSFLHNQIRRTIGCCIAAARGRISLKDIYEMLTIPSKHSWNSRSMVAPPFALYLCKVHYDENDFKFSSIEEISLENKQ